MAGYISIQMLQPPFRDLVGHRPANSEMRQTSPMWGFTRATRELYLPPGFKGILTPEWQATIRQYEATQSPKASHAHRNRHVRGVFRGFSDTQSGQLTTKAPQPQVPREKSFKIGDRVHTSHGIGTVVEVDNEKYLVDLDGQAARLWGEGMGTEKDLKPYFSRQRGASGKSYTSPALQILIFLYLPPSLSRNASKFLHHLEDRVGF